MVVNIITRLQADPDLDSPSLVLLPWRHQGWPQLKETFGGDVGRHQQRTAFHAGLMGLCLSAPLSEVVEATELEHLYGDVFDPAIVEIIAQKPADEISWWLDVCYRRFPCGRLLDATAQLNDLGFDQTIDLEAYASDLVEAIATGADQHPRWIAPLVDAVAAGQVAGQVLDRSIAWSLGHVPSDDAREWLIELRAKVRRAEQSYQPTSGADLAESDSLKADNAVLALRRPKVPVGLRELTPEERDFKRHLHAVRIDTAWDWWLAAAIFETVFRQDFTTAPEYFAKALDISDWHPQVVAEWAFYCEHVQRDEAAAISWYERATDPTLGGATDVDYELYGPELATMVQSPAYDHGRTLAKYAGLRARVLNEYEAAEATLEQALFARRQQGANRAEEDPLHITFLRQLVRVSSGEADVATLFGFDEWAGPALFALDPSSPPPAHRQ